MVSRNDFELYAALHLTCGVWFSGLRHVPQTDIVSRCTAMKKARVSERSSRSSDGAYHAKCRPSGNATTQDTTPELTGLRRVFKIRGVPARPACLTS